MAATSDIRWGIIGPGWIAELFAEDLARTPGRKLRGRGLSRSGARRRPSRPSMASQRPMATMPPWPAIPTWISSTSPPRTATTMNTRGMMLEGGKPVMVEKPFTMNAAQAADLIDLARRAAFSVMDAMWTLCNPLFRLLADRVAAGDIGTPRTFSAFIGPMGASEGNRIAILIPNWAAASRWNAWSIR